MKYRYNRPHKVLVIFLQPHTAQYHHRLRLHTVHYLMHGYFNHIHGSFHPLHVEGRLKRLMHFLSRQLG
jgi:hypothetical protein